MPQTPDGDVETPLPLPEIQLIAALMTRAILDSRRCDRTGHQAAQWLESQPPFDRRTEYNFTFEDCCLILGYDTDGVRLHTRKYYATKAPLFSDKYNYNN